jgi:hypothetical protein
MKARPSLPGVLSLVPLAGFLWLMFYAYVAYLRGGYWPPVYGRPDPTNIRPWITGYVLMGSPDGFHVRVTRFLVGRGVDLFAARMDRV